MSTQPLPTVEITARCDRPGCPGVALWHGVAYPWGSNTGTRYTYIHCPVCGVEINKRA
jgi:hypothetical protein